MLVTNYGTVTSKLGSFNSDAQILLSCKTIFRGGQDLQAWRGKLDTQVKSYREVGRSQLFRLSNGRHGGFNQEVDMWWSQVQLPTGQYLFAESTQKTDQKFFLTLKNNNRVLVAIQTP